MTWSNIKKTAIRKASVLASQSERPNGFRADLFKVAQEVGIDRIEEQDLPTTALLIARPDHHYTVFLKKGSPVVRQRFSIAHEIGHILLRPLLDGRIQHRVRLDPRQDPYGQRIERLCDSIAAELLVPKQTFINAMTNNRWSALTLHDISNLFAVSLDTIARRFIELSPHPSILAKWRLNSNLVVQFTTNPLTQVMKGLRYVSFITENNRPSKATIEAYVQRKTAQSSETVRLDFQNYIKHSKSIVESIHHGNGQWGEVFSFIFPESNTDPIQKTLAAT